MKRLLPLGSVVMLQEGKKKLVIYGRIQKEKETEQVFDYVGCFYPQGIIDSSTVILFNHEDIEQVYYIGYQEEEEFAFQQIIADFYAKQGK